MTKLSLYLIIIIIYVIIQVSKQQSSSDKEMKKLILQNQIGYHYKKGVQEVAQELFVSRKMDVSPLFQGVYALETTKTRLESFCRDLNYAALDIGARAKTKTQYVFISPPEVATFYEAKKRCEAHGLQLPEVYTSSQNEALTSFLISKNISSCFAGIQPSLYESISRFIATGFPIWRGFHEKVIQEWNGVSAQLIVYLDDVNVYYSYTKTGKMIVSLSNPSSTSMKESLGVNTYRDRVKDLVQHYNRIVCEPKWDGTTYVHSPIDKAGETDININVRYPIVREKRSNRGLSATQDDHEITGIKGIKEYCLSITRQTEEIHLDLIQKMTDLLSLVDISVQTDVGE